MLLNYGKFSFAFLAVRRFILSSFEQLNKSVVPFFFNFFFSRTIIPKEIRRELNSRLGNYHTNVLIISSAMLKQTFEEGEEILWIKF
jgi:hypothetical protein